MDVRQWFLRYAWVVNLLLLGGVAYVSAQTTNQYLANKFLSGTAEASVAVTSLDDRSREYHPPMDAIIGRDLFKAAKGAGDASLDLSDGDTADLKATDLRIKLLGIAYYGEDYAYNLATIKNLTDQKVEVYISGKDVLDDAKVHAVKMDHVILARADGNLEVLKLEEEKDKRGKKPGANTGGSPYSGMSDKEREEQLRKKREALRPRPPAGPDLSDRIKQINDNEFVIQKDAIDEALSNLNSIITQARVIPHFVGQGQDRKLEGFRIYRIKPGSIFLYLGLKNGDVIKSINGERMDSVEKGLQLLQSLRNETSFGMDIERQNNPIEFSYEVE